METKHTPGPWKVTETSPKMYAVETSSNDLRSIICRTHGDWICDEHGGNGLSNARLISKAWLIPEVIEFLTILVEHVEDHKKGKIWDINFKGIQEALDNARNVLVKLEKD